MKRREFSLAALATVVAAQLPAMTAVQAQAIGTLKMMIPANPGGGWDQTGRALAAAMQSAKVVQLGAVREQGRRGRRASGSRSSSTARRATRTRC